MVEETEHDMSQSRPMAEAEIWLLDTNETRLWGGLCNRDGLEGRVQDPPAREADQDHRHELDSEVAKSYEPQTRIFSPTRLAYPSPKLSQEHIPIRYCTLPDTNFKTKGVNFETNQANPSCEKYKTTQN